jgi:hypothetical protein
MAFELGEKKSVNISVTWDGNRTDPGLSIQAVAMEMYPVSAEAARSVLVKSSLVGMNRKSLAAALIRLLLELDFKCATAEYEGNKHV